MEITPSQPAPARLNANQWRAIIGQCDLLFEVISNSMAPTIRKGERVNIRPLGDGEPLPGQITAYFRERLITHRFLGGTIFRGDNSLEHDPAVPPEEWVGIVTAVERNGRLNPLSTHMPLRTRLRRLRLHLRRMKQRF